MEVKITELENLVATQNNKLAQLLARLQTMESQTSRPTEPQPAKTNSSRKPLERTLSSLGNDPQKLKEQRRELIAVFSEKEKKKQFEQFSSTLGGGEEKLFLAWNSLVAFESLAEKKKGSQAMYNMAIQTWNFAQEAMIFPAPVTAAVEENLRTKDSDVESTIFTPARDFVFNIMALFVLPKFREYTVAQSTKLKKPARPTRAPPGSIIQSGSNPVSQSKKAKPNSNLKSSDKKLKNEELVQLAQASETQIDQWVSLLLELKSTLAYYKSTVLNGPASQTSPLLPVAAGSGPLPLSPPASSSSSPATQHILSPTSPSGSQLETISKSLTEFHGAFDRLSKLTIPKISKSKSLLTSSSTPVVTPIITTTNLPAPNTQSISIQSPDGGLYPPSARDTRPGLRKKSSVVADRIWADLAMDLDDDRKRLAPIKLDIAAIKSHAASTATAAATATLNSSGGQSQKTAPPRPTARLERLSEVPSQRNIELPPSLQSSSGKAEEISNTSITITTNSNTTTNLSGSLSSSVPAASSASPEVTNSQSTNTPVLDDDLFEELWYGDAGDGAESDDHSGEDMESLLNDILANNDNNDADDVDVLKSKLEKLQLQYAVLAGDDALDDILAKIGE